MAMRITRSARAQGLRERSTPGRAVLGGGGSAIDAVEAAVRVLEDDPCFNAGRGSTLNADGLVELDAAIMDGANRRAGAVAGVRTTRAPISLARALMERGPHVFLSYEGADRLAREAGLEQVENDWFVTARAPPPARGAAARRAAVRLGCKVWNGRRGRGRRRTATSPRRPRPAD